MERPTWTVLLAAAAILGGAAPTRCRAQATPTARTGVAPSAVGARKPGRWPLRRTPAVSDLVPPRKASAAVAMKAAAAPATPKAILAPPATPMSAPPTVEAPAGPAPIRVDPALSQAESRRDEPAAGDSMGVRLESAPVDPADLPLPINLAAALKLADARPLVVAAAQAGVWVAEAQLKRANVVWVPSLVFGIDYVRHDGGGPDFNKGILTAPSVNFFYGGAGLHLIGNVTDAIFLPLVARRSLEARRADVQAARNDSLLMTAEAYFAVHRARGSYAGSLYAVQRGRELVARVDSLAGDLAPEDEAQRARSALASLEQQATSAREAWRVGSADLTQVLRLDPRAVVVPLEPDHLQVTLVDPARTLDELVPVGLANRPELASRQAIVQAAEAMVRQEKMRPLLPNVWITGYQTPGGMYMQAGLFGIGPNSSLDQWTGRVDTSFQLVWQLEAFGIGNLARIKERRGDQSRAIADLFLVQDRVAQEVTESHARMQSAAARVGQAERALRAAQATLDGTFEGLKQTQRFGDVLQLVARPQEATAALVQLQSALDAYFDAVADYNRAQFATFHALGYPAADLARLAPPGPPAAIDTARPSYLPPVADGPPPATR